MEGIITNVNKGFLEYFGKELNEMLGHKIENFVDLDRTKEKNEEIWTKLKEGSHVTINEKYNFKDKKNIWLKQTFTPILSADNIPVKIINIASDITKFINIELSR